MGTFKRPRIVDGLNNWRFRERSPVGAHGSSAQFRPTLAVAITYRLLVRGNRPIVLSVGHVIEPGNFSPVDIELRARTRGGRALPMGHARGRIRGFPGAELDDWATFNLLAADTFFAQQNLAAFVNVPLGSGIWREFIVGESTGGVLVHRQDRSLKVSALDRVFERDFREVDDIGYLGKNEWQTQDDDAAANPEPGAVATPDEVADFHVEPSLVLWGTLRHSTGNADKMPTEGGDLHGTFHLKGMRTDGIAIPLPSSFAGAVEVDYAV